MNCYAERFALRMGGPGKAYEGLTTVTANGARWNGSVRLVEDAVETPLRWRKPRLIFVDSMSDLFHERVPLDFIKRVFATMKLAHWHRFQVLTKRSERLREIGPDLDWPSNVWMGVSVESQDYVTRIDDLRATPAAVRFLSLEPLLGPLHALDLCEIHWVIVGGESGPGARPMKKLWAQDLRDQALAADVPFFFKQWGGVQKKKAGRELDGRTWNQLPQVEKPQLSLAVG